jgi:hypothetical protein
MGREMREEKGKGEDAPSPPALGAQSRRGTSAGLGPVCGTPYIVITCAVQSQPGTRGFIRASLLGRGRGGASPKPEREVAERARVDGSGELNGG